MRVLVIGGTRFIGVHTVKELIKQGHEPVLLNRGTQQTPWLERELEILTCDRNDTEGLRAVLKDKKFDAVIDMILNNGTQAEAAVEVFRERCSQYFMISTGSVYKAPILSPLRENDPLEDNIENLYGYNKVKAEEALGNAYRDFGFPATILRLPAVYGDYDYQIRERYYLKRLLDKREHILLPDGGLGILHREYAGNVAAQLCFLLGKTESYGEIYNCGHHKVQTFRQQIEEAMSILGMNVTFYAVAMSQFPAMTDLAYPMFFVQSTAKLEALGWVEAYSTRDGFEHTINWLKNVTLEIMPTHRNKEHHFDYAAEDAAIRDFGVKL
jgi:nucleoside-diphosphate-sugar epimerase